MSFSKLIISKKETTNKNNLKDSEVFDPSCDLSSDLVYERKELYQIGEQFLEFIQEDYIRHLAILGSKGSGKTALVRYAMKELQKSFSISWYYINCAEADTSYKIAKKIIGEKKRLDLYKTLNNLIDLINTKDKKIFLILDEIDLLKDDKILYWTTRNNQFKNVLMILLTNKGYFYERISDDVKSSLDFEFKFFDSYNAQEIGEILEKRCKKGFKKYHPGIVSLISLINMNAFNSDVRVGLRALRKIFKNDYQACFNREEVYAIMEEEFIQITNEVIQGLNERNGLLLNLIAEHKYSHKVYQEYCQRAGQVVKSQFHKYLDELEKLNLIKVSKERLGKINTKELRLNLEERNIKFLKRLFERVNKVYPLSKETNIINNQNF